MSDARDMQQAEAIVDLLPRIWRRLFVLDTDDPANHLPVAQLRVCGILREGPLTISAVSKELGICLSAATQLADRLEKANLVERVHEEDDRRVRSLRLTTHGEQVMRARWDNRLARVAKALDSMDPESRRQLVQTLESLLSAAATLPPCACQPTECLVE